MVESKPAKRETKKTVEGYTTLTSPTGFETTVPDTIKDALLDSGYTE